MRKFSFQNNHFYHVYNRGVQKSPIFFNEDDYARFVHDLYEFNDVHPALDPRLQQPKDAVMGMRKREPLVDIVAWSLMPNHFHLLLHQRLDNGIKEFMRKMGIGYTMYVNKKYERSGYVFQGTFKAKWIDADPYLLHITRYIHLNPLDLFEPNWEKGFSDWNRAQQFLLQYRWSSYRDWIGVQNFPSVINTTSIKNLFSGPDDYMGFMRSWVAQEKECIREYL